MACRGECSWLIWGASRETKYAYLAGATIPNVLRGTSTSAQTLKQPHVSTASAFNSFVRERGSYFGIGTFREIRCRVALSFVVHARGMHLSVQIRFVGKRDDSKSRIVRQSSPASVRLGRGAQESEGAAATKS